METKNTKHHVLWRLMLAVLVMTSQVSSRALQRGDYESTELSDDQEVVDELQSFLPVRDPASSSHTSSTPTEAPTNTDLCATIFCGNGRTCVIKDGGPTCGCALTCPDHYHPICGTDGVTYGNPCELHRAACLQNIKIHKHLRGPCPGPPPTPEPIEEEEQKPLVCYEIERDQLRQLLIDWMKGRVDEDNTNNPAKSYAHVLTDNFRECDQDGDDQLSGFEFIQCVEKNQTIVEFAGMRPEHGQVLRGLCVDALILMSDTNEDWMLDLEEFLRCMDPNFEPPRKQCSLENKLYEDGAETRVDCNICVCACGNWVCSAMSCEDIDNYNLFEPYDVEQGPLPSKEERYALLRGFMAAEHVNLERLDEEVPPPDPNHHHLGFPHYTDSDEAAPAPAETPDTVPESLPNHHLLPAYDDLDNLWPDRLTGVSHDSESDEDEEPVWDLSHDEVSLGEDDDDEEEQEIHPPHIQAEVQPSLTNHAVVGGLPISPPEAGHEADDNEALDEYLAPVPSTVHPSPPRPVHTTTEAEVLREAVKELRVDDKDDVEQPENAALAPRHAPVEVPEPVVKQEVVTPHPTPVPTPARRYIPIVNFNITVAEHRIIHTGDSQQQQQQEQRIATEPIQQPEHGSRHDSHNGHLHNNNKHHNNQHHTGNNHHGTNHHSTNSHHHSSHNNQQPQGHSQDSPTQHQGGTPLQGRPAHQSA